MIKILHSADWHISLHRKKIPYAWQKNRFNLFFAKLLELEKECDIHIISGDVFDKKPEPDEITLLLTYLNRVSIPTRIIPGNHESTRKGKTFLEHFEADYAINNPNVKFYATNTRENIKGVSFQFFPYGEMEVDNLPKYVEGDILVTHIRGEVPPHITAEYNFEKLRQWKLILLGDLHFFHKYKDFPAYFSGSPLNVVYDRNDNREYGVNLIEFHSIDNYDVNFISLDLPKLIRKTVDSKNAFNKDAYHHVIYEVTGSIDELASLENNELLDKKIAIKPSEKAKIDLGACSSIRDELKLYLEYVKLDNTQIVLDEFDGLGVSE